MRLGSLLFLLTTACLTPRSIMQGQMAGPVGHGAVEVGVGAGIGYASQSTPKPGALGISTGASAWILPGVEGNAHVGLSDHLGINAHFSSAGIQPGLKITVNKSHAAHFALMPQFAMGFGKVATSVFSSDSNGVLTESGQQSTSMFTFMLGLRAMVSHVSGFYCGVGYDFIATRSAVVVGDTGAINNTIQHSLMVNVGYSIAVNWLRIRPEIAFSVQPSISAGYSDASSAYGLVGGGYGFAVLPGFSLVAVTPGTKSENAEEEEKQPEEREENTE